MMGWYADGPGWGGWIVMTLMMLAFWGLLVFGGVAVFRTLSPVRSRRDDMSGAEQILAERFARGEIDPEDYRQRRALLRAGH